MVVGGAPALVSQLVGHTNTVNNVLLVPNDNAVISVSDDRYKQEGISTQLLIIAFDYKSVSNSMPRSFCQYLTFLGGRCFRENPALLKIRIILNVITHYMEKNT